jgi:D-serine deaminase-like pyridoxal phosphate-dependent protein
MRADSTFVRSMGHLDDMSADASSTSPAAPSAGTSADSPTARRSTDSSSIVGVRSGTVLDPNRVAMFRAVAARTDIAHRVLVILESGQGSKPLASAGQRGR